MDVTGVDVAARHPVFGAAVVFCARVAVATAALPLVVVTIRLVVFHLSTTIEFSFP